MEYRISALTVDSVPSAREGGHHGVQDACADCKQCALRQPGKEGIVHESRKEFVLCGTESQRADSQPSITLIKNKKVKFLYK